ncbi:hypothetical protein LCGC14_0821680, partial [marine sediment metagenome]
MARDIETKIVATDAFTSTLRALGKELQKVAEEYGKVTSSGEENQKKTSIFTQALRSAKKGYSSLNTAVNQYDDGQKLARETMNTLSTTIDENKSKVKESTSAVKAHEFMVRAGLPTHNLAIRNYEQSKARIIELNKANLILGRSLGGLRTQYRNHQKRLFDNILNLKEMGSRLKETAGEVRKMGKRIKKSLLSPLNALAKNFPTTTAAIKKAAPIFAKVTKAAGKLGIKLSGKLTNAYVKTGKIAAEFYKRLGGTGLKVVSQGLSLIGQRLVRINEGFGRIAGGGLKALKQGISDILRGGFQRLVETVRDFSVASIRQFADLELSMKKINIFGNLNLKSEKEFDVLQNSLNEMTRNSLFSMEEVSNAFEEVAAIGDFAKEGVKGLTDVSEAVVKMATATGEADLGRTSAVLMTTMNAFGIASADAMQTASVLTKIANDSALSVNSLGDAMGYVAGTASLAGMSLEETGAALAILSNQGLSASKSGTALNQALQKMTKPTAQ